jgi:NADPH-dependent curcumin reductase CurA
MTERAIHLKRRPLGLARADDFELVPQTLPLLDTGDVLVRNQWLSVDPFMQLVASGKGRLAPVAVGAIMAPGGAVGVVIESRHPDWTVGDVVVNPTIGWREAYVTDAHDLAPILPGAQPIWHLSALGLTGITAFVGIELVLKPQSNETIFISGAAGAVGSIALQLAKERNCRVIASTGSEEKAGWLRKLGADHVINYRNTEALAVLKGLCPDGLDVYFDNVGGATLEAAIKALRVGGRVGVCGAVSRYGEADYRAGPSNFAAITEKALTMHGISALLGIPRQSEIATDMLKRLLDGRLKQVETIVEGFENTPHAFVAMLEGRSKGKMVVKI